VIYQPKPASRQQSSLGLRHRFEPGLALRQAGLPARAAPAVTDAKSGVGHFELFSQRNTSLTVPVTK